MEVNFNYFQNRKLIGLRYSRSIGAKEKISKIWSDIRQKMSFFLLLKTQAMNDLKRHI